MSAVKEQFWREISRDLIRSMIMVTARLGILDFMRAQCQNKGSTALISAPIIRAVRADE
jgi:hypothetical protein